MEKVTIWNPRTGETITTTSTKKYERLVYDEGWEVAYFPDSDQKYRS